MLGQLIDLYSLVVLGSVIISWVQLPPTHPVATFLGTMTEPLLAPIRRVLPPMGGLDFSPLVLLFGLQFLRGLL
ncbi:MAG: YggT family protein [Vicinamibacterales bacterium]